ncbi:MAG: flagellar hook-associated protein FlgK [Gammaproteobacteria bacterium]|jgi:flagellar hook-associated protein 1 FlgK
MASGLLDIGSSALLSYQRALDTVGHNVANVNTPGYSRQRVELAARPGQGFGSGFMGAGVDVTTIRRNYSQFLTDGLRTSSSAYHEQNTLATLAGNLDNMLADDQAGLAPLLGSFFDAIQDVANNPASSAARQVMLSEAGTLVSNFQGLSSWMQDNRRDLATRMQATTQEINQLAGSIASLNQEIIEARSSAGGQPPNDLLDARDQAVLDLSRLVSLTTTTQDDGALNVFIGSGQSLVLGGKANPMGVRQDVNDPGQVDITIGASGQPPAVVTSLIGGGELGGLLDFRDQVLDPAIDRLGRIAIELGAFMNDQHRAGVSLNGLPGQDLFAVAAPHTVADIGNAGSISVGFDDVSQLTADNYRLRFDGSNWSLSRADSGQPVPLSGTGTAADPFVAEGISITVGAGAAAGDGYTIRPVRNGASGIQMLIADPRDLALAAPVRTAAAVVNTGTGQISPGTVTDISNPAFQSPPGTLAPPVLIRFTSPTAYEVIDQTTSGVIDTGVYDPATGTDVFPTANLGIDFGYQVSITGNPASGDEFTVAYNSGGTGDNRNALLLAGLQSALVMNGNSASFSDAYGELTAEVGIRTRQAQVGSDVQMGVMEQGQAAWASESGVNLDEEAAELVRYQQAYQAAAQIISVANQVFDTLINAVRN